MLAGRVGGEVRAGGDAWVVRQDGLEIALDGELSELDALAAALGLAQGADAASVLCAGWRRWSAGLPARLRGSYALLVWEPATARGVLARDRVGAVPLLAARTGETVCFATEQRALLELCTSAAGVDEVAAVHWLVGGAIPGQRTLHRGIERVAAGCHWRFDRGRVEVVRHGRVGPAAATPDDDRARLRAALEGAVGRAVGAAGGPGGAGVGVLLSGGFDSAAVAALAARAVGAAGRMRSYSLTFPLDPAVDESQEIVALTRELGLAAVGLAAEGGAPLADAAEHARRWRLPQISPNGFLWSPLLARAREDGVTHLLDGEGGDEVLGAGPYLLGDLLRRGSLATAWRLTGALGAGRASAAVRRRMLVDFGLRAALPASLHATLRSLRASRRGAPPWLAPAAATLWRESEERWAWKGQEGTRWRAALVHSAVDVRDALGVAEQGRRFAAEHGIALRRPLLDERLLETVLALDPALAFDPRRDRALARDALAGVLSERALGRVGKAYFDPFAARVLLGEERATLVELLAPGAELGAWVDLEQVRAMLGSQLGRGVGVVWRLAAMELWLRCEAGRELPSGSARGGGVRGRLWSGAPA